MDISKLAAAGLKLPILVYRHGLKPLMIGLGISSGTGCRHRPTCSEYALAAISVNGAWRGFWLAVSRFWRCRPGGSHGFDPAPNIRQEHHPIWAAWRYGRWRARDVKQFAPLDEARHG